MQRAKNNEKGENMPKLVKINEDGRLIGEDHPHAVLTDHEVGLLLGFLDEREDLVAAMAAQGSARHDIDVALTAGGLSYRCLAVKFEVGKSCIQKIANGGRRCQVASNLKPYP